MSAIRHSHARLTWIAVLLLPFALFWWQLPFLSQLTIGNDYTIFPTRQQQELLFSLRMGSFPLFVPGFAGGHTASALTLGQIFHPLTFFAAVSPGYWDGHALDWNTFYRLLSLGLCHGVLVRLFVRLRLPLSWAALLGGIAVYNLRMLDWFRFGSSLDGYVAFLFACAAILWTWLEPRRRLPRVCVVASCYCLIVSGHPQIMYYGLVGAGLTTLLAPGVCALLLCAGDTGDTGDAGDDGRGSDPATDLALGRVLSFYGRVGGSLAVALLLAAAYIAPFYFDFLGDNTQRVGRGYDWADGFRDTLVGTFQNFVFPLRASVWTSFGGTALFLVAALTPLAALSRRSLGSHETKRRPPKTFWALWLMAVLLFLHMQGGRTPLHGWVWRNVPLANSFRIAGRITMLLPWVFALLLAWQVRARVLLLPTVGALAVTVAIAVWPDARFAAHPHVTPFAIPEWSHAVTLGGGLAALVGLLAWSRTRRTSALFLLAAGTLLQLGVALRFGTWTEDKTPTPSFAELREEKRERVEFSGDPGNGLYPGAMVGHIERGPAEAFLGKLHEDVRAVRDVEDAYEAMEAGRDPLRIFVHDPPEETVRSSVQANATVHLDYASFNRLTFRIEADEATYFGLGYPWSRHWSATIDGEPAPVLRANGAYQAIHVPAGTSELDVRYTSRAASTGMLISLLTLACTLAWLAATGLRGAPRWPLTLLALSGGPLLFLAWTRSLHAGTPLGTTYAWSRAADVPAQRNLAYGRRAWVSSLRGPQYTIYLGGRAAVDGQLGSGTGALTRTERNPVWCVDLLERETITEIVLHEGDVALARRSKRDTNDPWNARPLLIQASDDYETWRTIRTIQGPAKPEPRRLQIDPPQRARFVRIVGNETRLALTEVEIHGP